MAEGRTLMPLSAAIRGERPANRRIYLVRNAESCDRLSQTWRHRSFRDHGIYRLTDLNQPVKIVHRPPDAFKNDAPVTQVGSLTAQLVGRGMSLRACGVHTVFCSPALRCVQTAASLLSTLNMKRTPKLCVEPGLIEPLYFYWQDRLPQFLSTTHFDNIGFGVDSDYDTVFSVSDLSERLFAEKTVADVYARIAKVASIIQEASKDRVDGGVLVVTHAPVIDALMRAILGKQEQPQSMEELHRLGLHYPFCSVTTLEQDAKTNQWSLTTEAVPRLSYMHMSTAVEIPVFD